VNALTSLDRRRQAGAQRDRFGRVVASRLVCWAATAVLVALLATRVAPIFLLMIVASQILIDIALAAGWLRRRHRGP
jgi:hypothetical protein